MRIKRKFCGRGELPLFATFPYFVSVQSTATTSAIGPLSKSRRYWWALAWLGSTPIGGPIVGWVGQDIGARWSLVIGGLPTILCGILASPALSRIDRRMARTRGPAETSPDETSLAETSLAETSPAETGPEETSDDHSPAISSVSPAG